MNPYPVDPLHVPETVRVPDLGDTPTYFLPSRKRPYLALAFGAFVVGVVVAVWWFLGGR